MLNPHLVSCFLVSRRYGNVKLLKCELEDNGMLPPLVIFYPWAWRMCLFNVQRLGGVAEWLTISTSILNPR
jgi:hypothetical protein